MCYAAVVNHGLVLTYYIKHFVLRTLFQDIYIQSSCHEKEIHSLAETIS